jgi:hypothetical protein
VRKRPCRIQHRSSFKADTELSSNEASSRTGLPLPMNHELQLQRVQRTLDSQQFKSMKMRLLLLTLLMAWGGTAHAAANRTAAQDTHALAALKECVYDGELSQWNYLRSWRPGSDPCNDGW